MTLHSNKPGGERASSLSVALSQFYGVRAYPVVAINAAGYRWFLVWCWQVFYREGLPGMKIGFICVNCCSNGVSTWKF